MFNVCIVLRVTSLEVLLVFSDKPRWFVFAYVGANVIMVRYFWFCFRTRFYPIQNIVQAFNDNHRSLPICLEFRIISYPAPGLKVPNRIPYFVLFVIHFKSYLRIILSLAMLNGGWSGGAMVLGKLPVPGRPTIWIQ